jgi:hypothetical protein
MQSGDTYARLAVLQSDASAVMSVRRDSMNGE